MVNISGLFGRVLVSSVKPEGLSEVTENREVFQNHPGCCPGERSGKNLGLS